MCLSLVTVHRKAICWLFGDVMIKKILSFNDAKQEQENGDCKKNRDLKKPAVSII